MHMHENEILHVHFALPTVSPFAMQSHKSAGDPVLMAVTEHPFCDVSNSNPIAAIHHLLPIGPANNPVHERVDLKRM